MKKIIYSIVSVLLFCCISILIYAHINEPTIKEGDVVFKVSRMIHIDYISKSCIGHCGIVVNTPQGLQVLEATNRVKLTPLDKFFGYQKYIKCFLVKRVTEKPVKIKYKSYLGKPYDNSFSCNNDSYYCSELVHEIYKTQYNIKIADYKQLKEFNTFGVKFIIKNMGLDLNQLVITPADMYNSSVFIN